MSLPPGTGSLPSEDDDDYEELQKASTICNFVGVTTGRQCILNMDHEGFHKTTDKARKEFQEYIDKPINERNQKTNELISQIANTNCSCDQDDELLNHHLPTCNFRISNTNCEDCESGKHTPWSQDHDGDFAKELQSTENDRHGTLKQGDYVSTLHGSTLQGTGNMCKISGFTQYKDGSFNLEIILPFEVTVPDKTKTKFLRLFFDKESYEFLNMREPES